MHNKIEILSIIDYTMNWDHLVGDPSGKRVKYGPSSKTYNKV
jgi:hypothetical protein